MTAPNNARSVAGFIAQLVDRGLLTEAMATRVMAAITATGHQIDTVVIELGLMREEVFAREVANYLAIEFLEDPGGHIEPDLHALGHDFLSSRSFLPLRGNETTVRIAAADPFDHDGLAMVEYCLERPLEVCVAVRSAIKIGLALVEPKLAGELGNPEPLGALDDDLERLRDFAQQAPVVRFVAKIAQHAFDEGATDIHFEPHEHSLKVRIRVDGDLKPIETAPIEMLPGIVTRIKILAGLDISERRLPQDGRLRLAVRGQEMDLRVSIVPSIHGETVVLRILDRSTVSLDLRSLGFDRGECEKLARLANAPNGVFLVTGPTGSGKTTTLYALLSSLNKPDTKIFAVEDPVEYQLAGITQLQINNATGLTFARALRSVLRQDPDIILIGEIRDRETAEIAMQAALTGHLVFSTLHTNSAMGAVTRLRDMGIPSFLIGATLRCVLGQRLLRRVCSCVARGQTCNCRKCGGAGYKGRTAAYETLEVSPLIAQRISSGASEIEFARDLIDFVPIERHATSLVKAGVTTRDEVARVVNLDVGVH